MKEINWEYDIPKLRNILTVIVIIFGILMIVFHWTTADFVFNIILGLIFVLAVRSFMKYNM